MLRSTRIVIYSLFLAFAIAIAIAQGAAAATITSPGAVQAGILHLSKVPNSSPSHSIPKVRGVIPLSTNRLLSRDCPRTLSTMDSAFVPCLYLDTRQCYNVKVQKRVTGTNTISIYGLATFFCGLTDNGGLEITTTVLCPAGVAPVSKTTYTNFPSGITENPAYSYLTSYTGFCEHCVNHVAVAFPFFTMTTSVYAYSYQPEAGQPVNDPASYSQLVEGTGGPVVTGLKNSPAYRIPCP